MLIFIAEDDPWYAGMLEHHLRMNENYRVETFQTGQALLARLDDNPDVITLDYRLPDTTADQLLRKIRVRFPDKPVVVISGQDDVETAVQLLKVGATDYLVKSEETRTRLWNLLTQLQTVRPAAKRAETDAERGAQTPRALLGQSAAMKEVFARIKKAAATNLVISISGETGTGKELVARAIHEGSKRRKLPFVPVNIAAIPEGLIESELFGHEKGAFTGAQQRRTGKIEQAGNGTLFLDEIGEMDLNVQAKLLRVLQERRFTRLGSNQEIAMTCHVVIATHRNLVEEVKAGRFRQDLYYRLLGLPIELPALRNRREDIGLIAAATLEDACQEGVLSNAPRLLPDALEALEHYPFPGNVRELKALVLLAAIIGDGEVIRAEDLQFQPVVPSANLLDSDLTLREYNVRIIEHYMHQYGDNVLKVARKLDIGKSTIYRMLKENQPRP